MGTKFVWTSMLSWLRGVSSAAIGLFLARVILEIAQRPWSVALILAVGILAAISGSFLAREIASRPKTEAALAGPALLLLVYVVWPYRDPTVAIGVATLAILVWLLSQAPSALPQWSEILVDGTTFIAALVTYVATAAPDVLPADAGEFQLAATLLGVAHPPGFPLYTMMGHLFIRLLPWGTPAYRLNILSGIVSAGTLVLLGRATRQWAKRLGGSDLSATAGGIAAALTLGTATTFWAQATIASKRPFTAFFVALILYLLSRFVTTDEPHQIDRTLVLLSLTLSLGLGHHPALAFLVFLFVIYILLHDPELAVQPRRWWRPALAWLIGLSPLAYLPIRGAMDAPLAPNDLNTLSGFLHHFLALGFEGDMFAFANVTDLPHRLALLPTLFPFQFNVVLLAATLLGFATLLRRDWRLFILLGGSLVLHTFVSITYRAPQTVEYLIPAYLPVAILVGLLPTLILTRSYTHTFILLCALVLWSGLLNGWNHGPSFVELADDHTARQTVGPLLESAPPDALILADWRWAMPLRYLQEVEGTRPDVVVRYVYPVAGKEYRDVWLRRIQEADPGQPILLTHFYQFKGYTTEPWETGFLIHTEPVVKPEGPLTPAPTVFGDQIQFLGYSLRQGQQRPGQVVEFVLAWRAKSTLNPQPSLSLRLIDGENNLVAHTDRRLDTGVSLGGVHFERLPLPLYPNLSPGRYRVTLGAYVQTDTGFENLRRTNGETDVLLTDLALTPSSQSPFTLHRRATPFDQGPTLTGVDYDRSVPGTLRVHLHWRGAITAGWRAQLRTAEGIQGTVELPPIPDGAYQTTVVDLPGEATSSLKLALIDASGGRAQAASSWGWPVQEVRLPRPAPDARFVPLGGEMAVVNATAHPVVPGETMPVDVTLIALQPLTTDDAISVRLMDDEGRWLDTHDCQPALGALPTLKWIRGSQVTDRHLLKIPADFAGDDVKATLLSYERFRMTPLLPLDGRFDQVPLGSWSLP